MPQVPERPLSKGEIAQASRLRRFRRTNKSNHVQQRRSARRKKKLQEAHKNDLTELAYQRRLGLQLKERFGIGH